ncbi:hypothetical protein MMUR_19350 [Mycolicibacterium murale]|uniref:PE-PPE domain-containing protein n=2 Tax=Mycolicibacterium murale TaxID=182220 RepID=A0A7I9WJN6_9MYCO|nr:hypothetical protein MMUR_19350 [Mycolicibacterium murale]
MRVSLRSMLVAGVSTVAISGLAAAPVRPLPAEHPTALVASAPVQLAAAVTPLSPPDVSSAMAELALPVPGAGDISTQNAASDFVNWVYAGIVEWSMYLALELAPYVLGFLPGGWLISDQIYALYYPILQFTDSVVFDLIDPVLNDPLNLEVWANGISAVAYTAVASLLNAGINEVNLVIDYFLSWLPPLPPIPPWPPFPGVAAAADVTAQAAVPGIVGGPLSLIADVAAGLAHNAVNLWYPPSAAVDSGVGLVSSVLDGFSFVPGVGVADFQLNEFWGLIHSQGNNAAGLANDLISIVNDLVTNTLSQGLGPAVEDAYYTALLSLQNRGEVAVQSLRNFTLDQVQYLTGVWVPHVTSPRVDLPQGPPDEIRFTTPQVLRDLLGPLAGLVPSGTLGSTPLAVAKATPEVEQAESEDAPAVEDPVVVETDDAAVDEDTTDEGSEDSPEETLEEVTDDDLIEDATDEPAVTDEDVTDEDVTDEGEAAADDDITDEDESAADESEDTTSSDTASSDTTSSDNPSEDRTPAEKDAGSAASSADD